MQEFKAFRSTRQDVYQAFRQAKGTRIKERYHCILLAYDGLSVDAMSAILGREQSTIREWLALFNAGGLEKLKGPVPSSAQATWDFHTLPGTGNREEEKG